jgi:hypothetical protein
MPGMTREQILSTKDMKIEAVFVPQWENTVYVRSLNGTGLDAYQGSRVKLVDNKVQLVHENTRARLLALTLCDEQGKLMFTEEDIEELGAKNAAALDVIFEAAQRMNGLRPQDLEEKVKNSAAAQINGSGIFSH